jgi:ligand-binding sensor domain-containing protein
MTNENLKRGNTRNGPAEPARSLADSRRVAPGPGAPARAACRPHFGWTTRIAWGGVLVLGAASGMSSALLPNIPGLARVRHELPVTALANPDRTGQWPAGAADARGQALPEVEATVRLADLRLVSTVTDPDDTRGAVTDEGGLWVATGGGLLRLPLDEPGSGRWWTTADGLPDHRLTAIETIPGGLAVGTEGGTVMMLTVDDGVPLVVQYAQVAEARVSDLLFADDALYVATWGEGIHIADGLSAELSFREVGPRTGMRSRQVTSIEWLDGELIAGTAGAGLWVRGESGRSQRYVEKGGLAGDFVLDLAVRDGRVWVATPTGISRYSRGQLHTWKPGDSMPPGSPRTIGDDGSLAIAGGRVGRFGTVATTPLPASPDGLGPWNGVPLAEVRWFVRADGRRWAGTDRGVLVEEEAGWRWLTHPGTGSNDITVVASRDGSLAVGTFDRGAWWDGRALPLANAEVNDAWVDEAGVAWFGTSGGLARVDDSGVVRTYGALHGLDSIHVTAVRGSGDGLVVGTSAGVQRFDGGGFQSELGGDEADRISHVYCVAVVGEEVFAGTLNGLWSLRRSGGTLFRYESGQLPDNWINGLAIGSDGRLWAGTYDHGLAVRDTDGSWRWLREGDGVSSGWVNPSAMAALPDGTVLVGTMGGGLLRVGATGELDRWTMADGLAGDDVTSVAVDGDVVWIGSRSGLSRMEMEWDDEAS